MTEQQDPKLILKQSLVKERLQMFDLATLEPTFYEKIQQYLKSVSDEEREPLIKYYNSLIMLRQSKIIKLAETMNQDPEIRGKLTTDERALYDAVAIEVKSFNDQVFL